MSFFALGLLPFVVAPLSVPLGNQTSNYDFLADKTEIVYNADSNLITGKANAIAELDNGSIWIGQYAGLTRFNGSAFTTYYEANDINLTSVVSLFGLKNTLYVGTQFGLVIYQDGDFKFVKETENTCINDICAYENTLYFGTNKGLFKQENSNQPLNKINNENIINVACDGTHYFYITNDNLCYRDGNLIDNDIAGKVVEVFDNHSYIGTVDGKLYEDGNFIETITKDGTPINDVLYEKDQNIFYVVSDHGLFFYKDNVSNEVQGLKLNKSIEDIIIDYQGNIWMASSELGVCKITNNYFTDLFFKNHIDEALVTGMAYFDALLYVATYDGVKIIDQNSNIEVENQLTDTLAGLRIRSVTTFKDKIYFATYDTNDYDLVGFDGTNLELISKEALVPEDQTGNINSAGQIRTLSSNDDYLFIGTNYGISRYDGTSFISKKTTNRPLYIKVQDNYLYSCYENGGASYSSLDLTNEHIIEGSEDRSVLKVLKIDEGVLYSSSNELFLYKDQASIKVKINIVGSIVDLFEYKEKLYVGSDTGIYVFDKKDILSDKITTQVLDSSLGLKHPLSSNTSGHLEADYGVYYFATSNTIYEYNLEQSLEQTSKIKIGFDDIIVDNKHYHPADIKISENAQRITINISYFNYLLNNNYNVHYKLEGFDDDFHVVPGSQGSIITYTNLKGGKYTFKIYTTNRDGDITSEILSIKINKELKFLERPINIVLIVLFGLIIFSLLALLIFRLRIRSIIKKQNEYKAITLESIEAIARTIDAKDAYTNGHSMRVGKYSRLIAERLNLNKDQVDNIYYIALLHDIGKIAIPDSILNKPGKLTDEEFAIMRSHTTRGANILASISTIPEICAGAKYHHEKYNGTGYPEGLAGENIPYIARIICCADCFDAMATKRSYKEPFTKEFIMNEFKKNAGIQFDPDIANIVVDLIDKDIIKIE